MSPSPNYTIRNAGKSVRRLCTLITIKDNLRAEAPRSFLSSNASTRDQILLQINQIKILVYTADYWDPLLLRMTNNGEGKWTTIQEKLKIPAQGLPWKQINFLSSETRDVCSVNLFTNEWLHKLEGNTRNTAVNYSRVYVWYFRYTPMQTLSGLITRFLPFHVERNAWQLALRMSAWEARILTTLRYVTNNRIGTLLDKQHLQYELLL